MIAVFFGGRSCEHDISIITGLQALSACRREAVGVYIDSDGVWWAGDRFDSVNAVKQGRFGGKRVHLRPSEPYLYCKNKRLYKIDAALLCMHGMLGEDGCMQGLLEMCGIPYTGSGVLASAVGMNKLFSKKIFESAGLSVLPYSRITRTEYESDAYAAVKPLIEKLGFPMIIKPCNLGSSIGITIAKDVNSLYTSLRVAFEWDDIVIAEKALENFIEVNCAVIGDGEGDALPSDTEQPVGWTEFLSFYDKYSGDVKATRHKIPADVGTEMNEKIQELAVTAYNAVGCEGVARVDFLVKDGEAYVNEINTIPGSLANPLFRRDTEFSKLIDKMLAAAALRKARFDRLKHAYTPTTPIIGK